MSNPDAPHAEPGLARASGCFAVADDDRLTITVNEFTELKPVWWTTFGVFLAVVIAAVITFALIAQNRGNVTGLQALVAFLVLGGCSLAVVILIIKPRQVTYTLSRKTASVSKPGLIGRKSYAEYGPCGVTFSPLNGTMKTFDGIDRPADVWQWIMTIYSSRGIFDTIIVSTGDLARIRAAIDQLPPGIVTISAESMVPEQKSWSFACAACGYSLLGLELPRCPECGTAITELHLNYIRRQTAMLQSKPLATFDPEESHR